MRSGATWQTSFAIVEAMIDPVVVLRPMFDRDTIVDFEIVAANEAALTRLPKGARGDSPVGHPVSHVMPEIAEIGLIPKAALIMTTGTPQRIELSLGSGSKERQWEYTGVPYGDFMLLTAIDVTHRHERDRARAEIETIKRITAERERVARDLHDNVIQQLIGASMVLARVASWADAPVTGELEHVISIHDDVVRELRSILFGLQRPVRDLRAEIDTVVTRAAAALGFEPELNVDGIDVITQNQLAAAHMLLTLREVLSNIARHAEASHAWVRIEVTEGHLTMRVDDDGCGIAEAARRGRGLDNLGARAALLDGTCDVGPRAPTGTTIVWTVPLGVACGHRTDDPPGGDCPVDGPAGGTPT